MNKILIIDDDLESCKRIKYHIQSDQTEVYYAISVHDGLKHLLTQDYTVLIMDVYLCEMDGLTLLKNIRQMKNLPIIALSSKGSLKEKAQVISSGADDYLPKPQEQSDLEDCLIRTQALMRRYSELGRIDQPTYTIVNCGSLLMNAELRTAFSEVNQCS